MSATRNKKTKNNKKKNKQVFDDDIKIELLKIKLFRYLKNFMLFLMVLFVFVLFMYRQNIYNKINNMKLVAIERFSYLLYNNICFNIEVTDLKYADRDRIDKYLEEFCEQKDKINMNTLLSQIKSDPWIKNVSIKKRIPNTLKINIEEYIPFLFVKTDKDYLLVDEEKNIINIDNTEKQNFYDHLTISGDVTKDDVYTLYNMLSSNVKLFSRIRYADRIGERRWNFILDNGIVVKMPEKDLLDAWNKLNKILRVEGVEIDLKSIDLRIKDKIYLEYK